LKLTVDLWDVGQGDCSVITLPDGRLFIIDVGPPRSPIVDWLESQRNRAKKIYAIAITHNDEDHAGCLDSILERWAPDHRIEYVFMLLDQNPDEKTRRLLDCVTRYDAKDYITLDRMETRKEAVLPLFGADGPQKLTIYAVYPHCAPAMKAVIRKTPQPNLVSGIICLDIDGKSEIIWPGDAPMQTIKQFCKGKSPLVIFGPHHGAPVKRELKSYPAAFETPDANNVFISVGTTNIHQHPIPDFINRHRNKGRTVFCSQLVHCDRRAVENRRHIMNHHLLLNFVPPHEPTAVTCRGPVRMSWNVGTQRFEFDGFHQEHRNKVKGLHDPLCEHEPNPS
jgi:hypothetical protein